MYVDKQIRDTDKVRIVKHLNGVCLTLPLKFIQSLAETLYWKIDSDLLTDEDNELLTAIREVLND